jgi:uncharacterized RDD family membrane protein YckC
MAEGTAGPTVAPRGDVHVTGRRVLAIIFDGLMLGVIFGVMSAFFGTAWAGQGAAEASLNGVAALVYFLIAFAYFALLEGYLGQTLGKMLLGIKVIREDSGEVPGIGAASIRTLLRIIDGLFAYLVGFIAVLASSKRQRLGDMTAHTLVVRK